MKWVLITSVLFLSTLAHSATTSYNEKLLSGIEKLIRIDFPNASRISVEKPYTSQAIPDNATVEEVKPRPPIGNIHFKVSWLGKNGKQEMYGTAVARIYLKVAVSKTPVRHAEAFSEDNVRFEERELTPFSHTGYFTENSELFLLSAQGNITPDRVITTGQTMSPQLIRPGQLVDLVYETPRLKISVRTKALQAGKRGESIRVENTASRKIIQGKVTSANEVSIQ